MIVLRDVDDYAIQFIAHKTSGSASSADLARSTYGELISTARNHLPRQQAGW